MDNSKGNIDIKNITQKLTRLKDRFLEQQGEPGTDKSKCFVSVGYKDRRARVFTGIGNSLDTAYRVACDRALKFIKSVDETPPWLKADFVVTERKLSLSDFEQLASLIKKSYFKYGISFDEFYNIAFLQQELNGASLIKYTEGNEACTNPPDYLKELAGGLMNTDSSVTACLNFNNINSYLKSHREQPTILSPHMAEEIILFDTRGYFYDQEEYFELCHNELDQGRRKIDNLTELVTLDLLRKSSEYLAGTIKESGRFVYGYFSCYNKEVPKYNSVRHALGVYSLTETYAITREEFLPPIIKRSLDYLLGEFLYTVEDYSFVVDYECNNEIKLGALAITALALAKYIEVFGDCDQKYLPVLIQIGNAIIYMQNPANGRFTHVIRYPDLELIDSFRIIYYSGEAAFALMRIYSLNKNEKWLKGVRKAFEFFISNDYWKYNDHWLAYCTNELTAILPEDKYFEFGLKNTFHRLDFIINRITTWATFLEMLCASYEMVENIKKLKKDKLLEGYPIDKLRYAIFVRAKKQLNGIFFPEIAMYFKSPETILYGVFIKHHSFRVRNDDVAHHSSGYCRYLELL